MTLRLSQLIKQAQATFDQHGDMDTGLLTVDHKGRRSEHDLESTEAFRLGHGDRSWVFELCNVERPEETETEA